MNRKIQTENRQTSRQTERQTGRQTEKQTETQKERQKKRQKDRQTIPCLLFLLLKKGLILNRFRVLPLQRCSFSKRVRLVN
jgi:hypothetical protein